MEILLTQAENVLSTWQPLWSPFLPALLREEAIKAFGCINELHCFSDGGYPEAERQRLRLMRSNEEDPIDRDKAPVRGVRIEGNFLFDKPSSSEIRTALEQIGADSDELGDIWTINDRGAQAICTPEAAVIINGSIGKVRDITIQFETLDISKLQLPTQRLAKRIHTIEASTRLDAIASAGFGLSRTKVVSQIKQGKLRLNWSPVSQASKELIVGDRIHHQDRGSIEVINLELTKRQRWRVELLRK